MSLHEMSAFDDFHGLDGAVKANHYGLTAACHMSVMYTSCTLHLSLLDWYPSEPWQSFSLRSVRHCYFFDQLPSMLLTSTS